MYSIKIPNGWKLLVEGYEPVEVSDARAYLASPFCMLNWPRRKQAEALVYQYDKQVVPNLNMVLAPLREQVTSLLLEHYRANNLLPEEFPADHMWAIVAAFYDMNMRLLIYIRPDCHYKAEQFANNVVTYTLPRIPVPLKVGVTDDLRFVTVMADYYYPEEGDPVSILNASVVREYVRRRTDWLTGVKGGTT